MGSVIAGLAALLLIGLIDSIGKPKNKDKKLYEPGTIFIGRNAAPDDGYFVYKFDPYEILYEGNYYECQSWMRSHTSDE